MTTIDYIEKKTIIAKAASLARGERLGDLYKLCEKQKTVSTRKLEFYLDRIAEDMQLDAILLKKLLEHVE